MSNEITLQDSMLEALSGIEGADKIIEKFNKEILPKHMIPKSVYNDLANKNKSADTDFQAMSEQIAAIQKENEELRNASLTADERAKKQAEKQAAKERQEMEEKLSEAARQSQELLKERSVVSVERVLAKAGINTEDDPDIIIDLIRDTPENSKAAAERYVQRMVLRAEEAAKAKEKELYATMPTMKGLTGKSDEDPFIAGFKSK